MLTTVLVEEKSRMIKATYFLNIKFDLLETLYAFHCNHYFHKYIIFPTVELIQNTPPTIILPHPLSFPH